MTEYKYLYKANDFFSEIEHNKLPKGFNDIGGTGHLMKKKKKKKRK